MQIIYHLGAHCTESERLCRSLLRDRGPLSKAGTVVAGPARFRHVLREALETLGGAPASAETQAFLLENVMDEDSPDRIIFCNENFLGQPNWALAQNQIYARAGEKTSGLRQLFPDAPTAFYLSMRSPATFLQTLISKGNAPKQTGAALLLDPATLRWSNTVASIREACPDATVTVWCDEDAPVIWETVMRDMAGIDDSLELAGAFDLVETLINKRGMRSLRQAIAPGMAPADRHRIIAAHLEKFGQADALDMEIDMPDWTQDYIDQLDAIYDADVEAMARMPGVRVLRP
ncbi:hypothetical protein [Halodurantibacterium flavum]|uniref:Sulfotransferase n=1 Tax=Halodurantibacterium flavum TaxID=1382802 RepID=A0ABW4S8N4_9RHOB